MMAKQLFQNSSQKKLEGMILRLLKLSDQVIQALTVQKYIDNKINNKRRLAHLQPLEEATEIETDSQVTKKVRGEEDMIMPTSEIGKDTRFSIRIICHQRLVGVVPMNDRQYWSEWDEGRQENRLVIKRDDFLTLPKDLVVKISKEHAKIRGWKNKMIIEGNEESKGETPEEVSYQVMDTSVNGTYYLGNKIDGMSNQKPMKLQEGRPFQLRHGDWIGILMDKSAKTNDMMLGFEFRAHSE